MVTVCLNNNTNNSNSTNNNISLYFQAQNTQNNSQEVQIVQTEAVVDNSITANTPIGKTMEAIFVTTWSIFWIKTKN